ncbi:MULTISPECIES: MerR family transcriptional regulator [Microbacterium]|uniref:MerR family transcriptional regulator n=1 Tax=Microbacterium resistens TaxID=156977 RepID=A0ABY3RS92_9MICO|nr:MerR family transcriptional regulator [Microbacterium resistens]MBW1638642.1 MerR family transcriptional regulator [Microbacterium resistens]MDA4892323.1 MerR family transcriptional regulator [Streptomyces sp. MS2A]UGS25808.1 MerR family transcriptional regulator [Microbacterium resistens]
MTERDSGTPVYGIAIAAQLVGMPIPTLRLFESKGLLTPSRSDGGTRQYSDDDIDRLKRAGRLRDEGLNIAGISRVLDLEDANAQLQAELSESRGADGGDERPAS